jgi:hypothetical protein
MTDPTEKLEASKKLARDYIDQVFNQHNPDKAPDFVTGDLYAAERDIIAENDLVVVRLVVTATVKGSLLGAPADGKPGPVGRGGHLPGHRPSPPRWLPWTPASPRSSTTPTTPGPPSTPAPLSRR